MSKLKITYMLGVFLISIISIQAQSDVQPDALELVKTTIDNLDQLSNALFCLTRACNPSVLQTVFAITDSSEKRLYQKPNFTETNMYRASKLANETARAVNKLLALDPNCMDHFYTCPKKDVARPTHVPMELFELNQLLRSIVTSGKCINSRNALDATKLLSDSVLYIEGLKMSSDSPMKQYLPAVEMVAKGLDKMCKSLKNTDSMDAGNLGEVDPILVLVPGPVIDDSGVKNIIDSIRKFIKL